MSIIIDAQHPEDTDYPWAVTLLTELKEVVLSVASYGREEVQIIRKLEGTPRHVFYALVVIADGRLVQQELALISPIEIEAANEEERGSYPQEFLNHLKVGFGRLFPLWMHPAIAQMSKVRDLLECESRRRNASLFLYEEPSLVGSL